MSEIYYARLDEFWKKEEKYEFLKNHRVYDVEWNLLVPDEKHNWLTEGLRAEFETFLPMGIKDSKAGSDEAIFLNYSNGVKTNRDNWAYNFNKDDLSKNIKQMIDVYNEHVFKWSRLSLKPKVDDFVSYDDTKISWSEGLKNYLKRSVIIEYAEENLCYSIYRPFIKQYLYFDKYFNERRYQFHHIFPRKESEFENFVICVSGIGSNKPFHVLTTNLISCLDMLEKTQCFPFYTYAEDGSDRRENITDWALSQFRSHYNDNSISKWDVFHYIYGLLHSPQYREKYAANLKRELPRIPFAPDFRAFAAAGKKLADLHVNYEHQPEYPLKKIESPDERLNWRVEKMRLSKDKTAIIYNNFLTLADIPKEASEYRLGNRSALDWIIDQYQVKTDKRSGIINDPNRADDPQYIVRLIGKVITVSLETMKIVKGLPVIEKETIYEF
jgi:predicted helicase